jgi:hypothetical protein
VKVDILLSKEHEHHKLNDYVLLFYQYRSLFCKSELFKIKNPNTDDTLLGFKLFFVVVLHLRAIEFTDLVEDLQRLQEDLVGFIHHRIESFVPPDLTSNLRFDVNREEFSL